MASKSQNKYFMICPLNFILKYDLKKFINHIQTAILNRRLTETVINRRRFTHLLENKENWHRFIIVSL